MSAPAFHEDWFSDAACGVLAHLVTMTEGVPGKIIEVGCWEGKSTIAVANAAYPDVIHAVDTWDGSPGEISATLAGQRDVFNMFLLNVAAATKGNVTSFRMDWRDYFAAQADPVRFCFIDAEHTYDEVRDNIAAVLPLLEPGGIICGDDVHHPPVRQAVVEALPGAMSDGPVWWWQKPSTDLEVEYRRLCRTPSDIFQHLPRFVELVVGRNAQHVIELGTRTGVSTVAWLHALAQTGGRLTSVDIDERPAIGDYPHWTFHQADDLNPELLGQLDEADIVFIDTSHLYEQTLKELNIYRWLVKPGGLILLHDTELERPEGAPIRPRFPVKQAVEEFCAEEGFTWTNDPRCWGLAVITVN